MTDSKAVANEYPSLKVSKYVGIFLLLVSFGLFVTVGVQWDHLSVSMRCLIIIVGWYFFSSGFTFYGIGTAPQYPDDYVDC